MTIVYAYVCADLIHRGHLEHLKNCKALGDKLVVGVLVDEAIQEKKERPIMSFNERVDLVRALGCTDMVVPQATYSPERNIYEIRPDIMVESNSHSSTLVDCVRNLCEKIGARLIIVPYYPGHSSTGVKDKIVKEYAKKKS
jgi:cytidyltransferase-like protein